MTVNGLPRARRNSLLSVTPGQLRTFTTLAELGSTRAAAERLNVTESAVSASVAALQRLVGATLVERAGRGVRLTPAGSRYAARIQRVLGELEDAAIEALGDAGPHRGRLRIAAVTTAAEIHLPCLLAGFRDRLPGVGLELDVAPGSRVWQLLRNHAVDLIVAGRPPSGLEAVTYAVRANELIVVGAPGLRTGADSIVWLLREHGSGIRATLEGLLDAAGHDTPRLTIGSHGAVVAAAVAGLGATLAPRDAVSDELAGGRLVEVRYRGTPLSRPYHLAGRRELTTTARRFVDHVLTSDEWRRPSTAARRAHSSRATAVRKDP